VKTKYSKKALADLVSKEEMEKLKPYIEKLNYLRFNLTESHRSDNIPPYILEVMIAEQLTNLRKEMKESGIKIPGYNI
tara:strand:- start:2063 stop:2296 length:234 start_codon:yes stop_codon:yes gene_type:complete